MVGLKRLDDLQACIESAVADGVQGDVIEAGVWRGGAAMLARATLDSLGETDRTVWAADSFQGLAAAGHWSVPGGPRTGSEPGGVPRGAADEVRGYFSASGWTTALSWSRGSSTRRCRGGAASLVDRAP